MTPPRSGAEGGLVWAIGASGLAHGAALAILALTPSRFEGMPTPPESYSVALVAPSAVGGTHLPGRPLGERAESPPQAEPILPPRHAEPSSVTAEEQPVVPAKAAEPVPKPAPPVNPPEAPMVSEPKSLPAAVEKVVPEPPAVPAVVAKPKKKESAPPRPVEKEEVAAKKEKPAAKAEAKKKPQEEEKQPARAAAATKESVQEPTDLDKRIAAAVERRADAAKADSNHAGEVDRQIAAAVQRRTMEAARAASGIGTSTSPVAGVGPGSGVGGVLRGIEYVMYRNQMESRIKAAWVWAGADRTLRAVVRFNVTEEGKIINVRTVQASGDASYDASVERAIRAADPLGAPPERYRDEFGTVELEFRAEDARG